PEVHTLVAAMNLALGAQGRTVRYLPRTDAASARQTEDLAAVTADLRAGRVQMLAILGGNPLFDAPADLDFAAAMAAVPLRLHLALYEDETSEFCHWHLPQSHYLEAWGDGRAHDGTATLVQPLIEPLYDSRSAIEVLS